VAPSFFGAARRSNPIACWHDDHVYVDDRTIDSHIKRLRRKFKVRDDEFNNWGYRSL
jgi:DNA-binding response OmpR family regulator